MIDNYNQDDRVTRAREALDQKVEDILKHDKENFVEGAMKRKEELTDPSEIERFDKVLDKGHIIVNSDNNSILYVKDISKKIDETENYERKTLEETKKILEEIADARSSVVTTKLNNNIKRVVKMREMTAEEQDKTKRIKRTLKIFLDDISVPVYVGIGAAGCGLSRLISNGSPDALDTSLVVGGIIGLWAAVRYVISSKSAKLDREHAIAEGEVASKNIPDDLMPYVNEYADSIIAKGSSIEKEEKGRAL